MAPKLTVWLSVQISARRLVRPVSIRFGRVVLIGLVSLAVAACGNSATVPAAIEPVVERLPSDSASPTAEWVAGVNAAGWSFHRHLQGNAVSSPMSIGVAFSLSRAGASADTAEILDKIFEFPASIHQAANAVDIELAEASATPNTLEVANGLFPDYVFTPRPEFLETAALHYDATLQPVDTSNGELAADTINDWVSGNTRGLIPSIVDRQAVQNQQLTLVNTVYLKADWVDPFVADFTSDGTFTTDTGQEVTVPFMRDTDPLVRRYVPMDSADAVELPYVGHDLAMWLIVPHEPGDLGAVEDSLNAATVAALSRTTQESLVDLTMPKWEQSLPPTDLFAWMCPLGFCAGAGFDGIAPDLFISSALHGAKVIVAEKGTEAAAVTQLSFESAAPPLPEVKIVADHPFLWAIVHRDTQAILFVGRLVNPAA